MELKRADKYRVAFAPIIYKKKNQEKYIQSIVQDNFKKLEYKGIGHVASELNTDYRLKFPFVKNSSFWEEGEWRIAVCSGTGPYNLKISDNYEFSKVKYRVADEKLISYMEMDFSKIKKELIKEIWIGPKSKIEINDVLSFLEVCGYFEGVAYNANEPILIRKSASSYR